MTPIEFDQLLKVVDGVALEDAPASHTESIVGVVCDSRDVGAGDLFVALPGTRHHGAEFLSDAATRGAVAAIVGPGCARYPGLACVQVEDAAKALWDLAAWNRDRCSAVRIAVTGSFAKTTTRQMIHRVLSREGATFESPGNFNNHVGVPLSLLGLSPANRFGVFEVAASGPGEIGPLAGLVRPTAAVLTGLGRAHLGGFGSLESVVEEKFQLMESLEGGGLVVVPAEYRDRLGRRREGPQVVTVGVERKADIVASCVKHQLGRLGFEIDGMRFDLQVAGRHFVAAALSAVAVARWQGIDDAASAEALATFRTAPGRCRVEQTQSGTVIDDSYNASPESILAACRVLSEWASSGRRVMVLGDMSELGEHAAACHGEIGRAVASSQGIDRLWAVGGWAESTVTAAIEAGMPRESTWTGGSVEELLDSLPGLLRKGDTVLVKGARRSRMERVVERFCRVGH